MGRLRKRRHRAARGALVLASMLAIAMLLRVDGAGVWHSDSVSAQAGAPARGLELLDHIGGATTDVAADGDRIFVGLGLRVARLQLVGGRFDLMAVSEPLDGIVLRLAVDGHRVVALTLAGAFWLDVAGTGPPRIVASLPLRRQDMPFAVDIEGHRTWLGLGSGGVSIVDISTPASPFEVARLASEGITVGVAARGDSAVVISQPAGGCTPLAGATGPGVLRRIRARPDGGFETAARLEVDDCVNDVVLDEKRAWLLDSAHRVSLVDIARPGQADLVGSIATHAEDAGQGAAMRIVLHAGCVVAVSISGRLDRVCPTDDGLRLQTLDGQLGWTTAMALAGENLVVSGNAEAGMRGVTLGHSRGQEDVTTLPIEAWHPHPVGGHDVGLVGDTAWLSVAHSDKAYQGLWRVDLSRPQQIGWAATEPLVLGERVSSVTTTPERVYAVNPREGMTLFDAKTAERLGFIGGSSIRDKLVPIADGVVFALQESVVVVDLTNLSSPEIVGRLQLPPGPGGADAQASALARSGNVIFVAAGAAGLSAVDISVPEQPVVIRAWATAAEDVAVNGDHVFVAGTTHLHVLSAAPGASPREIGAIDLPSTASAGRKVEARDGVVAVLDNGGVHLFDVRVPAFPKEIATSGNLGIRAIAWLDDVLVGTGSWLGLVTLRFVRQEPWVLWLPWLGGGG